MSLTERFGQEPKRLATPDTSNEVAARDPFVDYFTATQIFFKDFIGTPEALNRLINEGGYITLRMWRPDRDQSVVSIDRHISRYKGNIETQDTITVNDYSLLSPENHGKHLECNYEVNPQGDFIKRPSVDTALPVAQNNREYLTAVGRAFTDAAHIPGSRISVGNTQKFISNGKEWISSADARNLEQRPLRREIKE